jgi:Domain of unknown function (DUF5916)/Carbohydrate family 9 binding domain-like
VIIAGGVPARPALAQRESGPAIRANRISDPIVMDGLLNEESWMRAEVLKQFLQKDPEEGSPATELTEVRILYDARHIYFGITCRDSNPSGIRATELRRDNELNNDDSFELVLDTFHDHRNGYLLRVNPLGTQYDATITNEGQQVNSDWDEKWEVKTRVTETGWVAEFVVPFKILRFINQNSIVWGVNFHRNIKRKNEDVFWTAHNRNYRFAEVSRAGHLTGLSDIQGFSLRLKSYAVTGANKAPVRNTTETRNLTDVGIEDAKYMITPRLALDVTVNPDFAQADVDQAQVNLTRFSLFFPEKREFFQEGSGIFQFGTGTGFGRPEVLLFHSRRIGLSANREEIPIRAGLKLTGKQGPFDIGVLNMQTARSGAASGQNFTVLRSKANILARSYVGAMFTRNTSSSNGMASQAGGVDASFTFFQNLNFRGFVAENDAPGLSGENRGSHSRAAWDSDRFEFSWENTSLQKNFLPEMGFVARAEPNWNGVKRNLVEAAYKPRPAISWLRQLELSSGLDYITNQQGLLDTREFEAGISGDFQSGDAVSIEWQRSFERLLRPLRIRSGSTVPAGEYRFNQLSFMYRAFRGRSISGNVRIETGGFYNGRQNSFDISPQLKPSRNFSIEPGYERNTISLPGTPSFTVHQLNTNLNYSFNQRWLTRTTILLNSQDKQYAANFRLNYIFRPGDDLFVIYNEARTYGTSTMLQNRALIVKATFSIDH